MLRLAEVALLLAPIAALVAWRVLAAVGGPSPAIVGIAAATLLLLAAGLFWMSSAERNPPGGTYVPAHVEGGRIIPGHVKPSD
ncbi:MAG: hypothetical protein JOY71_16675 [Acetobacteraceae bacterium]|nr:hypothetical protein [Acetobacteraceae bacterium]MBV8523730.1 hypothetical protein [Acetobacteraceae bacterium]MBV8589857.1 hypothetical protein [Acetobacteraceae bacterium]